MERINLDLEKGNCEIAYEIYKDFKRVYSDDIDMLELPSSFQHNKCVYGIDNVSRSRNNIWLQVDFSKLIQQ